MRTPCYYDATGGHCQCKAENCNPSVPFFRHKGANRLKFRSKEVTIVAHRIRGMAIKEKTKGYLLRISIIMHNSTEEAHELVCYGLDEIGKVH